MLKSHAREKQGRKMVDLNILRYVLTVKGKASATPVVTYSARLQPECFNIPPTRVLVLIGRDLFHSSDRIIYTAYRTCLFHNLQIHDKSSETGIKPKRAIIAE